jgi:DeoR/GlpR family transcriptional regulator of sugar metabolism
MFALERIRLIRKYLEEHRQAEVHALSGLLAVSEVTIRRDLEKLERDGFLVRTHGGAILSEDQSDPLDVQSEADVSAVLVDEVGRLAARLIADGDTVMLSGGRLPRSLARSIAERSGVTVLTNDILVAREIASQAENRAVLLGGDLDPDELSVYGALALDDLQHFHVDRLFAELDGFGDGLELSASTQQKAALIREARLRTRQFVILCLAESFSRNAFFRFGSVSPADTVVTDRTLSDEAKRRLFRANVRLFTAVDVFEGTV